MRKTTKLIAAIVAILMVAQLNLSAAPDKALGESSNAPQKAITSTAPDTAFDKLSATPQKDIAPIASDTALGEAPLTAPRITLYAAVNITMDRTRTLDDIVATAKALPHSGFTTSKVTSYGITPNFTPPYSAGTLAQADIDDALNAMKMVRYLAGLPYEKIAFTPVLNDIAQHGAVLLAASNQFAHEPSRPPDMPLDFYNKGYKGCSEANIYAGVSNISTAVLGFIADPGPNNLDRAGHRRWILKPGGQNFGIGYARYGSDSYGGHRINMHVFDGLGYWECESDSYIAWPSSGDFPIQYFVNSNSITGTPLFPWSVNLGAPYQNPDKANITLTLTRERDGKVWTFDSTTPSLGGTTSNGMHFAVDNGGYGMTKAIVFRPDTASLGPIIDGDIFHVRILGIRTTTGAQTSLEYDINFFDLNKEMTRSRISFYVELEQGGSPVSGATVTIDGQTLTTDANGFATLRVGNNNTYPYTITKEGLANLNGSVTVGQNPVVERVKMVEDNPVIDFIIISGAAEGYTGDEINIPVAIIDNPGVAGFVLDMTYDGDVLELISAEPGELTGYLDGVSDEPVEDGQDNGRMRRVRVVWAGSKNITGDGELYVVKFRINDNAPEGDYPLVLGYKEGNISNERLTVLSPRLIHGNVKVHKNTVLGIEITALPYKLAYKAGDYLDLDGMAVTAHYVNGKSQGLDKSEYTHAYKTNPGTGGEDDFLLVYDVVSVYIPSVTEIEIIHTMGSVICKAVFMIEVGVNPNVRDNIDGHVGMMDAYYLLDFIYKYRHDLNNREKLCDINGDGYVDMKDFYILLDLMSYS